jgi:hypothetical protein
LGLWRPLGGRFLVGLAALFRGAGSCPLPPRGGAPVALASFSRSVLGLGAVVPFSFSSLPGGVVCCSFFGAGRFASASVARRLAAWLGLAWLVVVVPGAGVSVFAAASPAALAASPAVRAALALAGPAGWRVSRVPVLPLFA